MGKIDILVDGAWMQRSGAKVYARRPDGRPPLRLAAPEGSGALARLLTSDWPAPIQLLYILHTPRGEGAPGRYQSPGLSPEDASIFLTRFENFFAGDSRHDLWIRSASLDAMLIRDRHDDFFVYDDLATTEKILSGLGYRAGEISPLGPHRHHYRAEFDEDAAALLSALEWTFSPLRPEDLQIRPDSV